MVLIAELSNINTIQYNTIVYNTLMSLTFGRTCIVIYSYNKSQRDAQFLKFI